MFSFWGKKGVIGYIGVRYLLFLFYSNFLGIVLDAVKRFLIGKGQGYYSFTS